MSKKEIVYYNNKQDLVKKIIFYSKNDKLRSKIAKKGYHKYHKYFSNKIVANYIAGEVGITKEIKPIWKQ